MSYEVRIGLRGKNPPVWAVGQMESQYWYYENEHGKQWVAKREGDVLWLSGPDIG